MKLTLIYLLLAVLTGCASYRPEPLVLEPSLTTVVPRLNIDTSKMPLPELAAHKFDPSDGLDMTEVAMLAVVNNPGLKLARDDLGIARAQAFSAGLLPDPQIGYTLQHTQNGVPGNNFNPFDLGLGYDISALVKRASNMDVADKELRKTDLVLLWQEWQVIGQARLLFVRDSEQHRLLKILMGTRNVAFSRYAREQEAADDGNLTLTVAAIDANVLQGIDKQINEVERSISRNEYALHALLGIAPGVRLQLVGGADLKVLDQEAISRRLSTLALWRPDLLALRAGYEAENTRMRQVIMAQFPAIRVGISRAGDNSATHYQGFSISLDLPIFNRNRGNITIEQATRARMHDEFQTRLNTACSDVEQLLADQILLEKQLAQVKHSLILLDHLVSNADAAFQDGQMDLLAYSSLQNASLSKQAEENTLEQSILEQRVALQTLLGGDLPEIIPPAGKTP